MLNTLLAIQLRNLLRSVSTQACLHNFQLYTAPAYSSKCRFTHTACAGQVACRVKILLNITSKKGYSVKVLAVIKDKNILRSGAFQFADSAQNMH